ncbi:helix-turn-helix domain-containing protein [Rhizobium lentis]|uniref:helix-turn-helix domain-containing protein n=1 Tax=Rhizobium lentis TaxID=1138194 RepID=UPI001C83E08F|nr:helix-turn-helix domain-containing protein [Rhizobium lentis]MBX5086717.1 helix-turn-helix domain-containing protein [Rhizobium lentis]MBX5099362.1 helix-turn-helix domain-containing protein [Rhizobium lentis]MBX5124279.1 helix-turn-helix domain-containing protein [Rhizobium lentis]
MTSSPRNNRRARWPSADVLTRAAFVDDAGPIRFVDTDAAAKYLALDAHTLDCYRSLDTGPAFYKFGRYVRYAVADLDAWAESCRRSTSASPVAPRILPVDPT